jgi:uncharacterized protein (DUF58 family)
MTRNKPKTRPKKFKFLDWLERRASVPEFAGWMLIAIAGFFFMAATNTLAGWLYAISGVSLAIMFIGGVLPGRILGGIEVERLPIDPVSAGDVIAIELLLRNSGKNSKALLEVRDILPEGICRTRVQDHVIESIAPGDRDRWLYEITTLRRGVFQFDHLELATASPFGLFRSRRSQSVKRRAIVYPTVLPLSQCPLVDLIGRDDSPRLYSTENTQNSANEGVTRTLRPYRWGDPIRLVHWRTSARFGELRVRELELTVGGQELVIAIDTLPGWQVWDFEQAVVAAASLYFYAQRLNLNVRLWTAATGLGHGNRVVLETLAAASISAEHDIQISDLPDLPLVWITHRPASLAGLPVGSRWILWGNASGVQAQIPGITIEPNTEAELDRDHTFRSLQAQLQTRANTSTKI